jgi:hypothetical protein
MFMDQKELEVVFGVAHYKANMPERIQYILLVPWYSKLPPIGPPSVTMFLLQY